MGTEFERSYLAELGELREENEKLQIKIKILRDKNSELACECQYWQARFNATDSALRKVQRRLRQAEAKESEG